MTLTHDAFVQLLQTFSSVDRARAARGKRRAVRIHHPAQVFVLPPTSDPTSAAPPRTPAQLQNFSPRGVGILLRKPLGMGNSFILQLCGRDQLSVSMLCRVIHCKLTSRGIYSIGAQFEGHASQADPVEADLARIRASILD